MKINRIIEQTVQKGRYSVFVDGTYAFSLGETALLESGLVPGQELTEAELKHWKLQSAEDLTFNSVLRYAALRLHSYWEMEMYLKRKQVSPALAESILNKLSKLRLVDDVAFARAWVENRRLLRPTSKLKLQQELRAKHVSDEIINQTLVAGELDETETVRALIAKKRQLTKFKHDDLKLMQYLARQGFNYEVIKSALRDDHNA